ncbi:CynX/NimT family MFS transporter [Actinoalloteichus hymeniacidonis]|uniref:CynX/NimT family MFS transporter n=1 Tax=Actinoalloteichus hymeniacidonis TaxID=340345 RepID=UPI00179B09A0|nr:MFS transporter [Actinoalloteichus hymeniacidonis]MBB5909352.1 CP family cyanate transporter-like MFS transporter [Actinoalloteichus hymeniacidonis]
MSREQREQQPPGERILLDLPGNEEQTLLERESAALADSGAPTSARRYTALVGSALLLVGVALAAANMRPAVTSLASVLGDIRSSLGQTATWASLLTTVPTLCFGLAGIAAPFIARRIGLARGIGLALLVLSVGLTVRVVDGPTAVLAGTFLACGAIAICNVLVPVVVKESFPNRIGMATGVYTSVMAAGGALGSALTPRLAEATGGWRLPLATWALLALAALCVWSIAARHDKATPPAAAQATPDREGSLLRSPLAWVITLFFAMQALIAYVVMGWLPEVFIGAGLDIATAGLLLSVVMVVGVPMSLLTGPLIARSRTQSGWALGLGGLAAIGILGLLIAPLWAPLLWTLTLGTGMAVFPLALTLISLRTRSASETARLSAMAQSLGYLIAATGPFLFGVLHDITGDWDVSLLMILGVLTVQTVLGVIAGRPRYV